MYLHVHVHVHVQCTNVGTMYFMWIIVLGRKYMYLKVLVLDKS